MSPRVQDGWRWRRNRRSPSAPSPEAQAAERSPQAPKGYVVLAIGLPGSGKTTWFRRRGVTPLSSDLLRNILFDDVEEQKLSGLGVFDAALAAAGAT